MTDPIDPTTNSDRLSDSWYVLRVGGASLALCFGPAAAAVVWSMPALFLVNAITAPMGLILLYLSIAAQPAMMGNSPEMRP
jgi:hypothetical protein